MDRLKKALTPYKIRLEKIRIGRTLDGGYPLFNHRLSEITSTFSYGISDDVSFEQDFTNHSDSIIYMYDHTINGLPDTHPQFRFIKEAGSSENFIKHITETGNLGKKTLVLKMDIEGHEWELFKNVPLEILSCFEQIVVEIHNLEFLENQYFGFIGMSHDEMADILEKLNTLFYLGHIHGNNFGGIKDIPNTVECSYIRKDLLSEIPPIETSAYPIPGIDFPNDRGSPDYILDWWLCK